MAEAQKAIADAAIAGVYQKLIDEQEAAAAEA